MDVIIDEIVSTVRAVDGPSLLDPRLVQRLVQAVLAGVEDQRGREKRRRAEARIGSDDSHGERED